MGYFKVKNRFGKNIKETEIYEKTYELVDTDITEDRLEKHEKISFKKKYIKSDKEVFVGDILVNDPPLPENHEIKKVKTKPGNLTIKKGVVVNDSLKYSKPNNLNDSEERFDGRFIGVNNERTEKIAVLVHCYFIDVLLHTLLPKLLPLAKHADFYFNFIKNDDVINQTMALEVIKSNFDNYTINYTNRNIGRDINGQFNNLKKIYENDKTYDFYLLVHTKKSKHMVRSAAQSWLGDLLNGTIGNYDKINEILDSFKNNEKIGIIGSEDKKLRTLRDCFELNVDKYNELCRLLKIDKNLDTYFIAGTMFWIRSEVLDHYLRKKNILKLFTSKLEENKLIDGDWHHAMERLYGTLCYNLGYTVNEEK
jgi:hypothetical protein